MSFDNDRTVECHELKAFVSNLNGIHLAPRKDLIHYRHIFDKWIEQSGEEEIRTCLEQSPDGMLEVN